MIVEVITEEKASMSEVMIIEIELAKLVFQFHGARQHPSVVFRKKLSGGQVLALVAEQPNCVAAMEAWHTPSEHHTGDLVDPFY
jgi:hypothetical protein